MPTTKVPTPEQPDSTQAAQAEASSTAQPQAQETAQESSQGGTVVKTGYPHASLSGEGFPTVTAEGTQLNSQELEAAQKAADDAGVTLTVEGGGQNG